MQGRFFQKPAADDPQRDRVPPGQYLAKGFPVLTYGSVPTVSPGDWELRIWGEIEGEERVLRWDDLMALPQVTITADFHCVTRWSKLDVTWKGVRIPDLLQAIPLKPSAKYVLQHCYGGYTTNLPSEDFLRSENFVAHTLNDQPLPREHGGPLRSVVPHLYAWKSAKWLNGIQFLSEDEAGFWERNGYHDRGDPWLEERYSDS